jgi:hypothetical protein
MLAAPAVIFERVAEAEKKSTAASWCLFFQSFALRVLCSLGKKRVQAFE